MLSLSYQRAVYACSANAHRGDHAAEKEIRKHMEKRVEGWKSAAPSDDYDVVATAFALAGHDAVTTRKLHPTTRAALDKVWTVQTC